MTLVMGYAAIEWFEKGERISNEKFRELSRELSQSLVERMRKVFTRKPSRKQLKKVVVDLVGEDASATQSDKGNES
jgi:uncharacterized hydantoinase/oxoprolinase family protein